MKNHSGEKGAFARKSHISADKRWNKTERGRGGLGGGEGAAESRGCLTELIDMIISHYFIASYLFHHSKIKGSLRSCGKPQALL